MFKSKKILKIFISFLVLTLVTTFAPTLITYAASSGVPGAPTLTSNQYGTDIDGDYDITANMYYGNNATSYKLYERLGVNGDFKVVASGALTDNTPSVQQVVIPIRGRQATGSYNYYIEFINSYGTSKSGQISVKVGVDGDTKILIDTIDDNGLQYQNTISIGSKDYKITNSSNANSTFSVISSNTSTVKASIVNGNTLHIEGISEGRSGIKITDNTTGDIRQIGFRVKTADGKLPGMPNYLSIGQVSQDTQDNLDFWKQTSNDDTNKRCDIRYIYVNGGPVNGWRSWTTGDGDRVKNYIIESLKLGMIPYFVYYNIPDSGESYDIDIKHINDETYMKGYFADLKYFLQLCQQYAGDETVGVILEPDFLGYMMQQSGKNPADIAAITNAAYSSGVLDKAKDPAFDNSVKGLVQSINYTINKYYPKAYFGWQFNIWSYDSTEIPNQGLLHKTEKIGWDSGRQFIKQVAKQTADYYMSAGITSYGASFMSIDKYGLDGGYEDGAGTNPKDSKWLWNSDIWNNYLLYTKTLHDTVNLPTILWQLPVGRLNSSQEANPYNNGKFPDLTNKVNSYEDSAPVYFFGDTFKPGSTDRTSYFSTNLANDPKIKQSGDSITWGNHMQEAKDAGIISMLFGAGVNASTSAVGTPPSDNNWWITKAQRYLKAPLALSGAQIPPVSNLPSKGSISASTLNSNGNYTITINIPASSSATSYVLYENGTQIKTGAVDNNSQSVTVNITNKPTGTYMYNLSTVNSYGSTASDNVTVKVNNTVNPPVVVPSKGTVSVDKASNSGSYNLTLGIPDNSNATSYNLIENGSIVKTGAVTTKGQQITVPMTNKTTGSYVYKLDLVNSNGTTSSDSITVTVSSTNPPVSGVALDFSVQSDWGSGANFTITLTNNTDKDISSWQVAFAFDKDIIYIPDASMVKASTAYSLTPKAYNTTISKGKSITLTGQCVGNVGNLKPSNVNIIYK